MKRSGSGGRFGDKRKELEINKIYADCIPYAVCILIYRGKVSKLFLIDILPVKKEGVYHGQL